MLRNTFLLLVFLIATIVLQCDCLTIDVSAVADANANANARIVMGYGVEPRSHDWNLVGLPSRRTAVVFNVALKQRNVEVLEETLYSVSNPKSERYGQYLSIDEILDIVAPPKEHHNLVVDWLLSNGIRKSEIESFRDAIKVTTTVENAEEILQTNFVIYQSTLSGLQRVVASTDFSIPSDIGTYIDMITGLNEFPTRISRKVVHDNREVHVEDLSEKKSSHYIIPETIKALYNFTEEQSIIDNHATTQGVVEFLGYGSFIEKDLHEFFQGVGYPFDNTTIIVGPFYPNGFIESELDIQYIMGVARNATTYYWSVEGWLYDFALDAFLDETLPMVFSMSYAWTETAQCNIGGTIKVDNCTTSELYVSRTNVEFMKLGARGVTLLASSGDDGAPGDQYEDCSMWGQVLSPLYPASSPYVLSVGATMLMDESVFNASAIHAPICERVPCASSGEEVVCSYPVASITSGGGFSNYAPRPSYQDDAVEAYFANTTTEFPPSKQFNNTNRGYPDVAGLGHNYLVVDGGTWDTVDGTSCSTPVWGAIITILNNIRINAGKAPLGFVNPLLYQIYAEDPSAFNDITLGNNKCTLDICCRYGYFAAPGWDAVTGLGTPNVGRLMEYVKNMPN